MLQVYDNKTYKAALQEIKNRWNVHTPQAQQELDTLIRKVEIYEAFNFKEETCFLPPPPPNFYQDNTIYNTRL